MRVISATPSRLSPASKAKNKSHRRSGCGMIRRRSRSFASRGGAGVFRPVSRERTPFINASLKVRPMAITSPTDFIWVPKVWSESGNFSCAHLGIFTTT